MARQRNWRKVEDENKVRKGNAISKQMIWEERTKYKVYKDGNFFIGTNLIPRWNPRHANNPGDGIFFNQVDGKFEAWKDGGKLSSMPWKRGWRQLVWWAHKFGMGNA